MRIRQLTAPPQAKSEGTSERREAARQVIVLFTPHETPSIIDVSIPRSGSDWHILHHQDVLHNFPLVFQTQFTFFFHCNERSFIRRVRRLEESKLLMIHELGANELEFYTNLFWSHFNYRYLMLKKVQFTLNAWMQAIVSTRSFPYINTSLSN